MKKVEMFEGTLSYDSYQSPFVSNVNSINGNRESRSNIGFTIKKYYTNYDKNADLK